MAVGVSSPNVGNNSLLVGEARSHHNPPVVFTVPDVTSTMVPASTSSGSLPLVPEPTSFTAGQSPVGLRSPVIVLQSLSSTTLDPDLATSNRLVGGG